jgi:isoleucyl-tRNA synthetase
MSHAGRSHTYPDVPTQGRFPEIEERILASWQEEGTFAASLAQRVGNDELVFYDGPPFANGLPHYGHLLTGFVKDAIPRYHTMRGRRVERRFGWDCHGLPAETEAEKELGISGRQPITDFGIDRFNDHCRTSVLRYTNAWERYVTRQGRWVDFENDYKTMDLPYMESVLWAFKTLYDRGLIYEGFRVLPYCWECETPLSNFETRQDDAYRERVDLAVTVAFLLEPTGAPPTGVDDERLATALAGPLQALAWTTTPWTLPSNLALAVGEDLVYALVQVGATTFVLAADRLDSYAFALEGGEVLGTVLGRELVGRRYRPLFPYFAEEPGAFVVLSGDFVTTGEGTGIVHLAPGFGEDDQRVCEAVGIPVVCPVDDRGRFDSQVKDFEGIQVFDASAMIADRLKQEGHLLSREEIRHSYPHCWRTDTPLIYRAVSSYFVQVTAIKEAMLENNQQIRWVPEHLRDGAFGKWLEGARDWSISRNRFWGTPIPVWKSDDPAYPRVDVYGSLDELEADFGVRLQDLHRPAIDALTRPNPDDPTGRSRMRRVTDVLDCWFDSGSMPFAQLHYPFENKERFEASFPADFICEYVGQTRGWFYTLHVLGTALFSRPAFSTCIAHGILLGNDGRKLSKRLRNYPDPEAFFATVGADAMRWYLCSSPVLRGQDVAIEEQAMSEPVRQVLNPIWNCWHFLSLYGRADGILGRVRTDQQGVLDRYALAKTRVLVEEVTAAFDRYDLSAAAASITVFLDALTNWYIRRSRDRFWRSNAPGSHDEDKRDAYDTLHTVLEVLCRIAAPLLPFLTEEVWRGLTGGASVHLTDWPDPGALPADPELVATMDLVREVSSAVHSLRKEHRLRARLPLRSLTFAAPGASRLAPFCSLLADEANVKEVHLSEDVGEHATRVLTVVPSRLGPRLGERTQEVIRAVKQGRWELREKVVVAGGVELAPEEYSLALSPAHEGVRVLAGESGVVVLDLDLDEQLRAEGLLRDLVRVVQQTRKQANLHVADRIRLLVGLEGPALERLRTWQGPPDQEVAETVAPWEKELCAQTLASSLEIVEDPAALKARPLELAGLEPHPPRPLPADPGPTGETNGAAQALTASFELPDAGTVVVEVVRLEPVSR